MPTDLPDQYVELLDKLAVREAIDRYWFALGHLDIDAVVATFLPDAQFGSHSGHDEIRARIEHSNGRLKSLNVVPGTQSISIDGDHAYADTQAMAFGVVPSPDGDRLLIQSLRYVDRLTRTSDGWLFEERGGLEDRTVINDILFEFELVVKPAR